MSFLTHLARPLGRATPLLFATVSALAAQQASPPTPESDLAFPSLHQHWTPETPVVPYTAAEWNHGVQILLGQAAADQSPEAVVYPKDSIRAAAAATVRQWLRTLKTADVKGLQLDPYGALEVMAGDDTAAQRTFAERLAIPGLTRTDSAFTLGTAVQAFAYGNIPARLPMAEAYMTRLDALPHGPSSTGVSLWQFTAHHTLSRASLFAGNTQAAITHATRAIELIPTLFFGSRGVFYEDPRGLGMYLTLADLLMAAQDSVALHRIEQQIVAGTVPSDSAVAADSTFAFDGHRYASVFLRWKALAAMLGQPAPAIHGTSWLNAADTNGHVMQLEPGVVHLVGLGKQDAALSILPAFARLAAQFPRGFQSVFLLHTKGTWGREFVTPTQETASLRQFFSQRHPTTVPVAIWAGEKRSTPDGGMLPIPSPTMDAFHTPTLPLIAVVDQHGKIRYLCTDFGRADEAYVAALIRRLLNPGEHS